MRIQEEPLLGESDLLRCRIMSHPQYGCCSLLTLTTFWRSASYIRVYANSTGEYFTRGGRVGLLSNYPPFRLMKCTPSILAGHMRRHRLKEKTIAKTDSSKMKNSYPPPFSRRNRLTASRARRLFGVPHLPCRLEAQLRIAQQHIPFLISSSGRRGVLPLLYLLPSSTHPGCGIGCTGGLCDTRSNLPSP